MNAVIQDKIDEMIGLCRRFRVARLELFGSAASDTDFDPQKSDIDFLVEFQPLSPEDHADCYLGLLLEMQDLYHRRIDLVETRAIRNRYFLEGVNRNRVPLYAA